MIGRTRRPAPRIVVMGVAGAGKTTIGRLLADRLAVRFFDADDFHAPAAIAAMRAGHPLDDRERLPWLERVNAALRDDTNGFVLACSALKRSYRDILRDGVDALVFVVLEVGEPELVERLSARTGHFAGGDLLSSQLATLELGDDVVQVPADGPPDHVADAVLHVLDPSGSGSPPG